MLLRMLVSLLKYSQLLLYRRLHSSLKPHKYAHPPLTQPNSLHQTYANYPPARPPASN